MTDALRLWTVWIGGSDRALVYARDEAEALECIDEAAEAVKIYPPGFTAEIRPFMMPARAALIMWFEESDR